jgi:hypothetical protein
MDLHRIGTELPLLLLAAAALLGGPVTASAQFGELSAGATSVVEIAGVRGELSFTVFAPPALIRTRSRKRGEAQWPRLFLLFTAKRAQRSSR